MEIQTVAGCKRRRQQSDDEEIPPTGASEADAVATHYNALPQGGQDLRKQSPIYQLRCFNNWIKSVMIYSFLRRRDCVLDLGCGKGGDLLKYQHAGIRSLYCFDIAETSIAHAKERYSKIRGKKYFAAISALDCFNIPIDPHVPPEITFDAVCAQFCIHYTFKSEQSVRLMLENVTCRLRSGGIFMGTAPNSNWLVKKARSTGKLEFGNSHYRVKFDQLDVFPTYGHKYSFTLENNVDDCPEYLIHWPSFKELAKKYKLELIRLQGFHEYYARKSLGHRDMLLRMNVLSVDAPKMSDEEWEVAGLYNVFVFKKK